MATGIIESIQPGSATGTFSGNIIGDETGDIFPFTDQNVTCGVDDPVSFSVVVSRTSGSQAVNVQCISEVVNHPQHPIKGDVNEDITVDNNQRLTIKNGGHVTGNITVQGGKLKIAGGGVVTGNISVQNAGALKVTGGQLTGDTTLNTGELMKVNGGGVVTGNITVQQGHKLILDNGTITGCLDIQEAFKIVVKSDCKIGG